LAIENENLATIGYWLKVIISPGGEAIKN
jgi:hypothetical protein